MKKVLIWGVVILVVMQLIPIDRTNKPIKAEDNFEQVVNAPKEVKDILAKGCYDCHSNQVKYPSYAYVAPISWAVKNHINEGREHVNFSEWGKYNADQKRKIYDEVIDEVKNGQMPMDAYIAWHKEANLTAKERKIITDYFGSLLKASIQAKN